MRLQVRNVSFSFDSVDALKDVSLEVQEGEILGVIGPNGSGKTTLLRCMNGKLRCASGAVLLDDRDVSLISRKEIARRIGVVPQSSSIPFLFTVFDIVLMGRYSHVDRLKGTTEKDLSKVQEALKLAGIGDFGDRYINEISGGEYQRVIIARALAQEPKILLLDEPTLHLDISHQIEILELIRELAGRERLGVVMVLHDLNLAARFADRLLLLQRGKVYKAGPAREVLTCDDMERVFRVKARITHDADTGWLNIVPLSVVGK